MSAIVLSRGRLNQWPASDWEGGQPSLHVLENRLLATAAAIPAFSDVLQLFTAARASPPAFNVRFSAVATFSTTWAVPLSCFKHKANTQHRSLYVICAQATRQHCTTVQHCVFSIAQHRARRSSRKAVKQKSTRRVKAAPS